MLPRLFDRVVREKKFLRTLTNEDVGAFLRSGLEAEFKEAVLTPKSVVLSGLQALEAELRKRAASKPDHPDFADLVTLHTRKGERVFRALVRTGFPLNGRDWRDYGAYAKNRASGANPPWVELDEEMSREEALGSLGPVEHADVLVCAAHVQRFAPGKGIWNEAKEQPITVRFVSVFEQQWRALIASVEASTSQQFRWTDW